MTMLLQILSLGITLLTLPAGALKVTPGSECALLCVEDDGVGTTDLSKSSTTFNELTCQDRDYSSEAKGIKFKNCLNCLQSSNAKTDDEDDTSWFLYNLRYAVDACIFGVPKKIATVSSPCNLDSNCNPLRTALTTGDLNPEGDQYEYCDADNGIFSSGKVDSCIQCFETTSSQVYFANFMTALKAGCQQRPEPGTLLGMNGTLFSNTTIEIVDPSENKTMLYNVDETKGLQTGAIVGITVGAVLLTFGAVGLFWVYHRKQKKLFADIEPIDPDATPKKKSINPSNTSTSNNGQPDQKNAIQMSEYELRAQRAYTNNAEYYNQVEKQMQAQRNRAMAPSHLIAGVPAAVPRHPAYSASTHSRQNSRNASPQPPQPSKTYKRDSYALQAYLNAAEDATTLSHLKASHHQHSRGPSLPTTTNTNTNPFREAMNQPGQPNTQHSRSHSAPRPEPQNYSISHLSSSQQQQQIPFPLPPPPQGPPPPQAPTLSLPSVPRIKVPKQYSPPQISVQDATPVDDNPDPNTATTFGASVISIPIANDTGPRFPGGLVDGGGRSGSQMSSSRGVTPSPEPFPEDATLLLRRG